MARTSSAPRSTPNNHGTAAASSGTLLSGGGGGGSGGFGMDTLQAMGILNALHTGDPRIDMILAMCLPVFVRTSVEALAKLKNWFTWDLKVERGPKLHHRTIVYRPPNKNNNGANAGGVDDDSKNTILMKAIQLYLHAKVNLELREADVDLTTTGGQGINMAAAASASYHHHRRHRQSPLRNNNNGGGKTTADILSSYAIIQKPPPQEWHDIGEFGDPATTVLFKLERHEEQSSNNSRGGGGGNDDTTNNGKVTTTRSFHFKSESGEAIDAFIAETYRWYVESLRSMEDHARYFYELKPSRGSFFSSNETDDEDSQNSNNRYKRYRLSNEKTFESLFFQEKESLVHMVDNFMNQTGKFGIKGIPNKLGILLHGPPGSGKTSLIKALAERTGRSIVNIPLSRVKTNTQLMSIFFDEKRHVDGEYVPAILGFKDVIFVMEDVDCATDVVKRRDGKKKKNGKSKAARKTGMASAMEELPGATKSLWHLLLESSDGNCKKLVKLLMEKSDRLKKDAIGSGILLGVAQRITAFPELSLMGNQNPVLQQMGKQALSQAKSMMTAKKAMQSFLSENAALMLEMIQNGLVVDDKLVDELLARSIPNALTKQMQGDDNNEDDDDDDDDDDDANANNPAAAVVTEVPSETSSLMKGMMGDGHHGPVGPLDMMKMKMMMAGGGDKSSMFGGGGGSGLEDLDGNGMMMKSGIASFWDRRGDDDLNLSGLLNVLDGVVDSPGRIVVMTTNHVDHLDPALIRPGRIDKKLLLGYMTSPDVCAMLEHYFEVTLSTELRERVVSAIGDGMDAGPRMRLTPAQVEQLTVEHDKIEAMVCALEGKRRSLFYPQEIVKVVERGANKRALDEGHDHHSTKRMRTSRS